MGGVCPLLEDYQGIRFLMSWCRVHCRVWSFKDGTLRMRCAHCPMVLYEWVDVGLTEKQAKVKANSTWDAHKKLCKRKWVLTRT